MNYKDRLKVVEKESQQLGLNPKLDFKDPITADKIKLFSDFCEKALIKMLIERFGKGDWSRQSLAVTSQTFEILQKHKVPCELIYGEVKINDGAAYGTNPEELKKLLQSTDSDISSPIHAWINVGKDYIIDPTISSLIHKRYNKKRTQNSIYNGKFNALKKQKLEYIPMLVGAKYLDVTRGITLSYQAETQTA